MKDKTNITPKTVKHVAQLANLSLTQQEIQTYTQQLQEIVRYIDKLTAVNTSKIKPTFQTININNVWRQDKKAKSFSQKEALSNASKNYQGYFVAENVFSQPKSQPTFKKNKTVKKAQDRYNAILTSVNSEGSVGYKDLFVTKNIETTAGSAVLAGYLPQYSATIVRRFEKAGFKTKYKLNQDAWGHGSSGENSDYGFTKNPWDLSKVPGGSSSGSAVVVSTGDVEVTTGTDTCGSIRLPASFTNICGIKPTYGVLSRYGVIAFASSLDCPGLFAPTVAKLKKYFKIIAGPDPKDATSQEKQPLQKGSSIKTIGLAKEFFVKGIDQSVKNSIKTAAKLLKANGYALKGVSLPHSEYAIAAYYIIAPTETSSNLSRYDGIRYGNPRSYFGPEAKRRIMLGSFASSAGYTAKYYEKAARIRTLIIKDFNRAFNEVEVILAPVSPTPPFSLGEKVNNPLQMYLSDIYAAPASLAGLPSLALPCGFTATHLPIGMQLIGPRWSEDLLFNLGEKYQQLTNWHQQKPKL